VTYRNTTQVTTLSEPPDENPLFQLANAPATANRIINSWKFGKLRANHLGAAKKGNGS
jgi:hypothetical protein